MSKFHVVNKKKISNFFTFFFCLSFLNQKTSEFTSRFFLIACKIIKSYMHYTYINKEPSFFRLTCGSGKWIVWCFHPVEEINSIFLSIRFGRITAGSKVSIRFVAITSEIKGSSWLKSSSIVRNSNNNKIWFRWHREKNKTIIYIIIYIYRITFFKSFLTSFGPTPKYFWISNSEPMTRR